MIKEVKITYDIWWEAVVEIDDSEKTLQLMKDQLLFWVGGQDMIDSADGNIEEAYLRLLAAELIEASIGDWSVHTIIEEFERKEGWCRLDGTHGVKLTKIDAWEFSHDDFDFEEKVVDADCP